MTARSIIGSRALWGDAAPPSDRGQVDRESMGEKDDANREV